MTVFEVMAGGIVNCSQLIAAKFTNKILGKNKRGHFRVVFASLISLLDV